MWLTHQEGAPLKKTDAPSLRRNEMPVAPQLVVGFCSCLPTPVLGFVWLEHEQVLWMLSQWL